MARAHRRSLWLAGALIASAVPVSVSAAADTSPASAIGNQMVIGITVSPAYQQTGLVVVTSSDVGQTSRFHLMVSHDGGASWGDAAVSGWNHSVPSVAVDAQGHEILYAGDKNGLLRSDDYGDTWRSAGAPGGAFPSPGFAKDGVVAVAGQFQAGHDYVLRNGVAASVDGSNGALLDHQFAFSPRYPSGGQHAAVLLSANDMRNGYPEVQQCNADFTCTGTPTVLPGSTTFAGVATLTPSSTYDSDGVVFAQSSSGIYKSSDGGHTFTPMVPMSDPGSAGVAYTGLALAPHYSEQGTTRTVYAGMVAAYTSQGTPYTESGVFRSSDGGTTWTRLGVGTHLADNTAALAVAPDGRIFAAFVYLRTNPAKAGLLCSTDGGNTWQTFCPHAGNYSGPKAAHGATGSGGAAANSGAMSGTNASGQSAGSAGGTATAVPHTGQEGSADARPLATAINAGTAHRSWTVSIILATLGVALGALWLVMRLRRRSPGDPVETSSGS